MSLTTAKNGPAMDGTYFPPGPRSKLSLPGLALRRNPLNYLSRLAARYGDIAHFRVGTQDFFLLNHPDHIRDVLLTNQSKFARRIFLERAKRMLGEGLLTSDGQQYRRHRQLIQPEFHRQRIPEHARMIVVCGEEFVANWTDGETRDVLADMRRLSLSVACGILFGGDVEWGSGGTKEQFTAAIQGLYLFNGRQSWQTLLSRKLGIVDPNRFQRACEKLDTVIYRLIFERRERGDKGDMLSTLLSARDESGSMSDKEVRDEVATLIEAGHITLASTLTWAWLLLSRHPNAEKKLHQEIDEALGGRAPVFEDLARLPYTNMVLLETMRLYPPVWAMSRRALQDYEVGGYLLPAGSILLMSQHVMHRDKRYYAQPHRFDPERWIPELRDSRPQLSYFPFGAGPRRCIGEGLALLEGVLLLASMASKWRLRSITRRLPKPVALVSVVVPNATLMRLEKR